MTTTEPREPQTHLYLHLDNPDQAHVHAYIKHGPAIAIGAPLNQTTIFGTIEELVAWAGQVLAAVAEVATTCDLQPTLDAFDEAVDGWTDDDGDPVADAEERGSRSDPDRDDDESSFRADLAAFHTDRQTI